MTLLRSQHEMMFTLRLCNLPNKSIAQFDQVPKFETIKNITFRNTNLKDKENFYMKLLTYHLVYKWKINVLTVAVRS